MGGGRDLAPTIKSESGGTPRPGPGRKSLQPDVTKRRGRGAASGQLKQVINVPTALVLRLLTDDKFLPCLRPINTDPSSNCWLFKEVTHGAKPKRRAKGADIYVNSGGASGGRLLPVPGSLGSADSEVVAVRRRYGRITSTTIADQHWKYHQYTLVRRNKPDEPWEEDAKGVRLFYIQPPEEIMTAWTVESKTLPGVPAYRLVLSQEELGIVQAEMMYHYKMANKTTIKEPHDDLDDDDLGFSDPRESKVPVQMFSRAIPTGPQANLRPAAPPTVKSAAGIVHPLDPDFLTISQAIQMLTDDTFKPGSRPERTGTARIYKEWHFSNGGTLGGCRRSRNGTLVV
jgi:hypothetical protein